MHFSEDSWFYAVDIINSNGVWNNVKYLVKDLTEGPQKRNNCYRTEITPFTTDVNIDIYIVFFCRQKNLNLRNLVKSLNLFCIWNNLWRY